MALYKAAFQQTGIIQVDDIQDVIDYSRAFQCGKLPAGNRVAIITISGGAGILMTDECVSRGMQVPQLAAATTDKLRDIRAVVRLAREPDRRDRGDLQRSHA